MNREDIINMALEAGFSKDNSGLYNTSDDMTPSLKRFAALVAAAEREACAKLCGDLHLDGDNNNGLAADLIRARGDKHD
jgi:hypothetical protein